LLLFQTSDSFGHDNLSIVTVVQIFNFSSKICFILSLAVSLKIFDFSNVKQ